ncbi:PREDICTED: general transcription factor II-I repeat domain-containing protein 2-like [Dufourea novaeangliae]|uniref:general transcription factor II-I repeat domain-containing protein 2-like n=1 Tax=Dufourea novaeangliae TaxID=178035 RepID=UPI00076734C5|nr:PREDICTED: general transcription factor II-I repeat domain-containing protein 2-like [Dufourea novaeangliae]
MKSKSTAAVPKEYNIRRHYENLHSIFSKLPEELCKQKLSSLKRELTGQQAMFTKRVQDSEVATEISFEISRLTAKMCRPFTDGDFVKDCFKIAAKKICPESAKTFEKLQLNRMTVQSRITAMSVNMKDQLTNYANKFAYFSLAIDESTDITSTAQLLIFARGITYEFEVSDELIGMSSLSGQMKGSDMLTGLSEQCSKSDLDLIKLSGITTDGDLSMIGTNFGLVTLLKQHLGRHGDELIQFHCIIHQESLCPQKLGFEHVMKVVVSTINIIKSRGLNHQQFKTFLEDIESTYGDLIFYTEVRWFSRDQTLELMDITESKRRKHT